MKARQKRTLAPKANVAAMQDQGFWISACGQVTKSYTRHIENLLATYRPNVEIKPVGVSDIWQVSETRLARKNQHVPGSKDVDQSIDRRGLAILIRRTITMDDHLVPYLTMTGYRLKGVTPVPRQTIKTWAWTIPAELVEQMLAKLKKGKAKLRGDRLATVAFEMLATWPTVPCTYETWLALVKPYWPVKAKRQPSQAIFKAIREKAGAVKAGTVAGLRTYRILDARDIQIWLPRPVKVKLGLVIQCSTRCSHAKFERSQAEKTEARLKANEWAKICQQLTTELATSDPHSRAINYLETRTAAHAATFWDSEASQVYR